MASNKQIVIGSFRFPDLVAKAVKSLRDSGFDALETYSPMPSHEIDDAVYLEKRSPVRFCTIAGALTGLSCAFLMTIWMSTDYPIRVSAKPLVSIPAFVVIGFECTILLGSIFTLLSMFHFSRIPNFFAFPSFRARFTEGTFGVAVHVDDAKVDSVKSVLTSAGAHHVEIQYVR